jgi:hypothetical protein
MLDKRRREAVWVGHQAVAVNRDAVRTVKDDVGKSPWRAPASSGRPAVQFPSPSPDIREERSMDEYIL